MENITCPECKTSVPSKTATCPHCGFPFNKFYIPKQSTPLEKKQKKRTQEFKLDPETVYCNAKYNLKESLIKLITPILWLAVPWFLLWKFTDIGNMYSFLIAMVFACCTSLAVPLFRIGRNIEHDVVYFADEGLGLEKQTDVINYGWLGIVLGIASYIGTLVLVIIKYDEWWPGNDYVGIIAIFVISLFVLLIPYAKRIVDFDYCCRYFIVAKGRPDHETYTKRYGQIRRSKKNELITMALVYSLIAIVLVVLGVLLAKGKV